MIKNIYSKAIFVLIGLIFLTSLIYLEYLVNTPDDNNYYSMILMVIVLNLICIIYFFIKNLEKKISNIKKLTFKGFTVQTVILNVLYVFIIYTSLIPGPVREYLIYYIFLFTLIILFFLMDAIGINNSNDN